MTSDAQPVRYFRNTDGDSVRLSDPRWKCPHLLAFVMIKKIVVESHDSSPEELLRGRECSMVQDHLERREQLSHESNFRQPNQCGAFMRRSLSSDHAGGLLAQRLGHACSHKKTRTSAVARPDISSSPSVCHRISRL